MLVSIIVALNVIGLVMVTSASSVVSQERYGSSWVYVQRQIMWTALGAVAFVLAMRFDYRRLRAWAVPGLVVVAGLLVVVFVPGLGVTASGSSRWIGVGPLTFQPAEVAKLAMAIFAADLIARRSESLDDWRSVLRPVLIVFGVLAVLIMRQPDMGTTIVVSLIVGSVLFAGGIQGRQLAPLMGAGLVVAVVLALAAPYRRARVLSFLDPFSDAGNTGYQAVQSLIALGSGGIFGVGLGAGRQKWLFLPNAHTDFIFAVIGEELGLVGAFLVVVLFAALGVLGFRTAMRAPDRFGFLLAISLTSWIVGQAVINLGGAVGLLPITGVPLPYVSFGGSALVFVMAASGLLVSVGRLGSAPPVRRAPAGAPARRGR